MLVSTIDFVVMMGFERNDEDDVGLTKSWDHERHEDDAKPSIT